ncbi:MAG: glucose-6-phosphate isomerase [Verrucomicrobiota bacterium]|jgi:glucose-6-phosphate isomerase
MNYSKLEWWERFQKYSTEFPALGLTVDLSRMNVDDAFFAAMEPRIQRAFADMAELEKGAIANPDENRMVGHYWLRNPALAPTPEIRKEIEETVAKIKQFSAKVHTAQIHGDGGPFKNYLLIGIGGSALGPQFVANALGDPRTDKLKPFFFDNTDPDGMDRVLATIGVDLNRTLCIIISKSGGTKETRNGMFIAKAAFEKAGHAFGQHAIAVTSRGSELDEYAIANKWLTRFPMWDWVGGRTSELSAVGLVPAALQGFNTEALLAGAQVCDECSRKNNVKLNPSSQLALAWYKSGNGKGDKIMVVIPYKDRLELFSKYLQQLLMESLGKEFDLDEHVVHQGITVLGNKGSTDQHSYIQQLRDGIDNFFVTFIDVLNDGRHSDQIVEPEATSEDYLHGFYLGTRQALADRGRESISIAIKGVSPFTVGVLIALFERAVGFYASLININAYHQPGVESGKMAANNFMAIQRQVLEFFSKRAQQPFTASEISREIKADSEVEHVFKICEYLSSNPNRKIKRLPAESPFAAKYSFS